MKVFVVLVAVFGICHCGVDDVIVVKEEETVAPQLCPEIIRYNTSFWIEHFQMDFDDKTGIWWDKEYVSEEETTDLPPLFPEGASRPFAMHSYWLMGITNKMWLIRYRTDCIIHWYQGETARFFVFDPQTGAMEKRILNARNVVTVIEAGLWFAADVKAPAEKYVLLGCTMAPGAYDADATIAKTGDVSSMNKSTQRFIVRFTKP